MQDIQKFIELKKQFITEREAIRQRLAQINLALGHEADSVVTMPPRVAPAPARARPSRHDNPMSLRSAILQVTKSKPLTKKDILSAVQKLGYRFDTKDPMNSMGVILYGRNPKFRNQNGKFSPA
jgi:hypothetical protein